MDFRSRLRITFNLLSFPFLYPRKKAYSTLREHFSIPDRIPTQADVIVALGCSLRPDGAASNPTRAIADRAAGLYKEDRARKIIVSGGNPVNGVSEGEAMRRVLKEKHGIKENDILLDDLPSSRYVGTLDQVRSIGNIFKAERVQKAILTVQPQQLPRAFWLFRETFPDIEFFCANPEEEYDTGSTQARMRKAWRFRLWNMIAWSGLWRR